MKKHKRIFKKRKKIVSLKAPLNPDNFNEDAASRAVEYGDVYGYNYRL